MEVKLKVVGGPQAGKTIPLSKSKFLIGRSEECHLRPSSDMISRHHCALLIDEDFVEVRDFGSKNGTYVNGERISGVGDLNNGDHLKVGPLEFELVIEHRVGGPKLPPVKNVQDVAARTAAAGGSDSEDEDIEDWLESEPETSAPTHADKNSAALNETQSLSLGDTGFIESPQDPNKETSIDPAAQGPPPPKGKKPKPGKLPPIPKHTHKDSSNAAADVLRNMMRRR